MDIKKTMEELYKDNKPFNTKENMLFTIIEKGVSERHTKAKNVVYALIEKLNLSDDDFDDFENALAIIECEIIRKIAKSIGVQLVL